MEVIVNDTKLLYEHGNYSVEKNGFRWIGDDHFEAGIILNNERTILFANAKTIQSEVYESGVGKGIRTRYRDIKGVNFAFDTLVWIEECTQDIIFEWIPVNDNGFDIKEIKWSNPFVFDKEDGYSLLPYMQGVMLPNQWQDSCNQIAFDGHFCSSAAYMPFLSQIQDRHGYIIINETPWDARYVVDHQEKKCGTKVSIRWLPSLGKMQYKRILRYHFLEDCDYNDICKFYRHFVQESGLFTTLKEKSIRNPYVDKLIGRMFVHAKINNDCINPFEDTIKQIEVLKDAGADSLYVHLNEVSVCTQRKGLKVLSDFMVKNNDMLGLSNQYWNFDDNGKTYQKRFVIQNADGSYDAHSKWTHATQNHVCTSLAKAYVKHILAKFLAEGIHIEASDMNGFTSDKLNECANPTHRMTRKECTNAWNFCFAYLTSQKILPSHQECFDWAMKSLVFAHDGTYEFMRKDHDEHKMGIPVPLFNLVYHDCLLLPWPMEKKKEDNMLYALLNGGAPYLIREDAYQNVDGYFEKDQLSLVDKIDRCRIVAAFHRKVAYEEMVKHEFLDASYQIQKTTFANGTTVTIDLKNNQYTIK